MSTARNENEMSSAAEQKKLLKVRKKIDQKRPKFTQFESWRLNRLKDHWRRPRGIDNKMRQNRSGWPRSVNVGWGSPSAVRGLHPSGMEEVLVFNVGDLAIIDPGTQVARIGGSVGMRKKGSILNEAEKRGIKVLNPGEVPFVPEFDETEAEEEAEPGEVEEEEEDEEP